MKVYEGKLVVEGKKFGVVVSRFNEFITSKMLDACVDTLKRHGTKDKEIAITWVPGSFEIPYAADKMAKTKRYDSVICIGALIRGGTPHLDY